MEVLSVAPREMYFTLRFSLTQIEQILDYLSHCVCEYDSSKEAHIKQADAYVREKFFTQLNILTEEVKKNMNIAGIMP